jgi:hypothetical protein
MSNEILEELWKVRENIARECNYDIHVYFQKMREFAKTIPPERFAKLPFRPRSEYPDPSAAVPLTAHEEPAEYQTPPSR